MQLNARGLMRGAVASLLLCCAPNSTATDATSENFRLTGGPSAGSAVMQSESLQLQLIVLKGEPAGISSSESFSVSGGPLPPASLPGPRVFADGFETQPLP
ncbi:hypothetical protein [Pseudomarimonas arenosa]|uniref:Uncharacterized protein n=1 Tax=Pseudomarimonas arenosa TaxID=2774145 RepID=A0AAW3ZP31_9GAMM|nr:hypothetical protein [Pseudomarimonas arenosa]MBD8526091.1 hypothetical protein [Pseudomarimonas arenosa]